MKPFNDYSNIQAAGTAVTLPKGGYICKIMGAEVKTYNGKNGSFDKLEISIDISEGEYKGFYAENYRAQTSEDKKWKGVLRAYVPLDDGSEDDQWTKAKFKAIFEAIEASNPGYHWDWNEKALKGKTVGVLFQNQEWDYKGKHGWKAQPYIFISADNIKSGKFKVPEDKSLKNKSASYGSAPVNTDLSDFDETTPNSDLPFDI